MRLKAACPVCVPQASPNVSGNDVFISLTRIYNWFYNDGTKCFLKAEKELSVHSTLLFTKGPAVLFSKNQRWASPSQS